MPIRLGPSAMLSSSFMPTPPCTPTNRPPWGYTEGGCCVQLLRRGLLRSEDEVALVPSFPRSLVPSFPRSLVPSFPRSLGPRRRHDNRLAGGEVGERPLDGSSLVAPPF